MSDHPFDLAPDEEVCTLGPSPLYFDRVFRRVISEHFSESTAIVSPYLRNKLCVDDYKNNSIRIEPYYVWTPESADSGPAVIITRTDWSPIFNKLMRGYTNISNIAAVVPSLWQGSHLFNCVSAVPIESAELAFEVANLFISKRRPVETMIGVEKLIVSRLGATTQSQHVAELWETPVVITYIFQKSFDILKHT